MLSLVDVQEKKKSLNYINKNKIVVYYLKERENKLNSEELEKTKDKLNLDESCKEILVVDLEKISLEKFKEIIKKCKWNVKSTDVETNWELEIRLNKENKFSFILDVSSGNVASILFNIYRYNKNYDADEYIEEVIESREYSYIPPVRRIVLVADLIDEKLSKLVSDLFYNCRIEIEKINRPKKREEKQVEG